MTKVSLWLKGIGMMLVLSGLAHAQGTQDLMQGNPNSITLRASIVLPSCTISNDLNNSIVEFGVLNPSQIQTMPVNSLDIKQEIINRSALGPLLSDRYRQPSYATRLVIDCPSLVANSVGDRMRLTFGENTQVVSGQNGASAQGFAFKLDANEVLANLLGILIYAEDVYANQASVTDALAGLVKPGVPNSMSRQSFVTQGERSVAYVDLFPGLFWANPPMGLSDPRFRLETDVTLSYI